MVWGMVLHTNILSIVVEIIKTFEGGPLPGVHGHQHAEIPLLSGGANDTWTIGLVRLEHHVWGLNHFQHIAKVGHLGGDL